MVIPEKKRKEKILLGNTVSLYIMTFSTQLLNLITIPFLSRTLGPAIFGKIGLATAYMTYVQFILDFGFMLSATQEISKRRDDKLYISRVFTSVMIIKAFLSAMLLILFMLITRIGLVSKEDLYFYLLYLAAYIANAFLPDYFYRGIESMKVITYRTICIKSLFAIIVILLVKRESDVFMVPFSLLIGNAIAAIVSYYDICMKKDIKMLRVSSTEILRLFRQSLPFFISRISITFYQGLNFVLLGYMNGTASVVGYYTSVDKLVSLAKAGASPIADSLLPYMVKNEDFKIVKKILLVSMPIITIGVLILGIFSSELCVFLFGRDYRDAGKILICALPVLWAVLPSYIMSFPILSPMGLTKQANISNVVGMCVQLILLALTYLLIGLNVYSLCIITSITEMVVLLFRVSIAVKYRNRIHPAELAKSTAKIIVTH